MRKKLLRQKALERRMAMTAEDHERLDRRIHERLLALPVCQSAQTILCFVSFRGEVETRPLIRHWLSEGRRVCAPRTNLGERIIEPFQIRDLERDLEPGVYGVMEPRREEANRVAPEKIDLCVVPGLLFDLAGHRLGYGGGFYDRFLESTLGTLTSVALAYQWQTRHSLPRDHWDREVDLIVTEEGVTQVGLDESRPSVP